jgi:hypothetical protein
MQSAAVSHKVISIFVTYELQLRLPKLLIIWQLVVSSVTLTKLEDALLVAVIVVLNTLVARCVRMGYRHF